jgi:hypothetical protein
MNSYPETSTPADRRKKAEILGAVLAYVAARDCEVHYCFLQHEMADHFGVGPDTISTEVVCALSALCYAGVVEISPHDPAEPHAILYGAETTIKAAGHVWGVTHFGRVPGPDDEGEAA